MLDLGLRCRQWELAVVLDMPIGDSGMFRSDVFFQALALAMAATRITSMAPAVLDAKEARVG